MTAQKQDITMIPSSPAISTVGSFQYSNTQITTVVVVKLTTGNPYSFISFGNETLYFLRSFDTSPLLEQILSNLYGSLDY